MSLLLIVCFSLITSASNTATSNNGTFQGILPSLAFAATNITRPDTPIAVIKFDVGRLEQDLKAYGQWTEYDFRGQERYRFTEISSDKTFLRLRGEKGNVQLLINFDAKTISGEWTGHPMAKLYSIVSVEHMVFAQIEPTPPNTEPVMTPPLEKPSPPTPLAELPSPLITPPATSTPAEPSTDLPLLAGSPPMLTQPIKNKKVKYDPVKVTLAKFKGGSYIKKRNLDWIETDKTNTTFDMQKIGHNKNSIFLFDKNRNLMIELDLKKKIARMSSGERLITRHKLTEITEEDALPPSPPTTDPKDSPFGTDDTIGRLSVKDRFECRKEGGFVERAGMLGYERCTKRYSDGGNVCLDSRDCQGKCMTTTDAGKQNVSGKCQMTDNPFGCRSEVVNGEAAPMLCVD